jgi:hypothetical protein
MTVLLNIALIYRHHSRLTTALIIDSYLIYAHSSTEREGTKMACTQMTLDINVTCTQDGWTEKVGHNWLDRNSLYRSVLVPLKACLPLSFTNDRSIA